jgi:hypothetical protein
MQMTRHGEISREAPIAAALADPLVRELMVADKVDDGELRVMLDKIADLVTRRGSAARSEKPAGS